MEIGSKLMDHIGIVNFSGMLLGEPADSKKAEKLIKELIDKNITHLILDLEQVQRINSTGLAILITASTLFGKVSKDKVLLVGCNDFIKGALTVTKLDQFFEHFDTIAEAVEKFQQVMK